MKKILLLLVAGISFNAANAQYAQSVVFTQKAEQNLAPMPNSKKTTLPKFTTPGLQKPTVARSAWFSFQDANASSNSSNIIGYNIYNDSSLLIHPTTGAPFNNYLQGFGTSFDPTSIVFTPAGFKNGTPIFPQPAFAIGATNAYTVDSVMVIGYYDRKKYNKYTDTLVIYVAAAQATGTALFTYNSAAYFLNNLSIPDGKFHLGTATYDSVTNTIPKSAVPGVIKLTKVLDSTAFADSTATGQHIFTFALPSALSVPAGGKLVGYQQYISGHKYPFNTNIDSVNSWYVLTFEPNGQGTYPSQLQNDFNAGLVTTSHSRYNVDTQAFIYQNVQYITSTYFYGANAEFDDPFFAFHLGCTNCANAGVENVAGIINSASAYPNPALSEVTVPFTLSQSATATVTLMNTVGQILSTQTFKNVTSGKATFNTSLLASGVYFYTVEANDSRTTNRFVVAH